MGYQRRVHGELRFTSGKMMTTFLLSLLTLAPLLVAGEPLYCAEETDPVALCNVPNKPSYLVADSLDCSVFYYCTDLGNENYGAEKMICQEGLAFNDETWPGSCDWRANVPRCDCVVRPPPTTTTTPAPTTTTTEASPSCPEGWVAGGDSCYLLSRSRVTSQAKAQQICSDLGGSLVEIESEAENALVAGLAKEAETWLLDTVDYWIGAVEKDGEWSWLSGSPLSWSNWYAGEGEKGFGGCAQLEEKRGTFYFTRADTGPMCFLPDLDNGYICEQPAQ